VAIKTCNSADEKLRRRFFREAQIAAGLQHPNIVTVYDLGVQEGVPYLVQELLAGEDLHRLSARRDPALDGRRGEILLQVARGLEYAHAHHVVHRDVKPSNIRVLPDGGVKIMDFGIAKLLHEVSDLTTHGTTLGTVDYLAPEQLRGQPQDWRVDIFSFGVLAYELLSFRRPFAGATFSEVSHRLLSEQPPPLVEVAPDCSPELSAVVARCLEKDPDRRYADFTAVLRDLGPALGAPAAVPGAALDTMAAASLDTNAVSSASAGADLDEAGVSWAPAGRRSGGTGATTPSVPGIAALRTELLPRKGGSGSAVTTVPMRRRTRRLMAAAAGACVLAALLAGWGVLRGRREAAGPLAASVPARARPAGTPAPRAGTGAGGEHSAGLLAAPGSVPAGTATAGGGRGERPAGSSPVAAPASAGQAARTGRGPALQAPSGGQAARPEQGPARQVAPGGQAAATLAAGQTAGSRTEGGGSRDAVPPAAAGRSAEPPAASASAARDRSASSSGAADPAAGRALPPVAPGAAGRDLGTAGEARAGDRASAGGDETAGAEAAVKPMVRGDLIAGPGPGVTPPRLVDKKQPEYPARARFRRVTADLVLLVLVDENGKVVQVGLKGIKSADSSLGFVEAARTAALASVYQPATRDGIPGRMWTELPFEFRLPKE
jgi:serine/threonine-protein kinase